MDIEQLEALALASDREAALATLIPGTEDYYFHHCLEHQLRGELDEVEALLDAWVKRHDETARVREIRDRQALLSYERDPAQTLEHIRRRLNLTFDHQRETEDARSELPTRLDPAQIGREAFLVDALGRHDNLDGFTDRALDWLTESKQIAGSLTRLRALLSRLRRPDYPSLVALVLRELDDKHSRGFGGLPIHSLLTLAQLNALATARPALVSERRFVEVLLSRLKPGPDVDLDAEPARMDAHLDTLWAFVEPLAETFNSLKLHVLYHRLDFDRRRGVYDRARFDRYIRLPRQAAYMASDYRRAHQRALARFGQDYVAATGLAPVAGDDALMRDYLGQIFADPSVDDYDAYRPFLDGDYLRRVFAETKILAGVGDQERWYSLLDSPSYYGELEDRVDIELAPDNPRYVGANEPVELRVDLKKVPALVVKVFEINTLAYFQTHGRELDTSVDLDGLVANHERVIEYDEPALRRVRRSLKFESLTEPGTYVIELIGGGKSSRALVRKGGLRFVERLSAAGHVLTILNEDDELVPEASVWFGGREYPANERAEVRIPYSAAGSTSKILLRHGRASSIASLRVEAERYQLRAGVHVEREQLIAGQTADLVIRATLSVNGLPAAPSLLSAPQLVITSSDRHGTSSSVTVALELDDAAEAVHSFKVPEALAQLSFEVRAKVRSLSEQRDVELSDRSSIAVNGIDVGAEIVGLHLAATASGYVLHALGKSGEPRPDMQVNLSFGHLDFNARMQIALQTDARGRVELGRLDDIDNIQASLGAGGQASWTLPRPTGSIPTIIHIAAGQELTLARLDDDDAPVRSLLERRGSGYLRERMDAVSIDDDAIQIRGLEPGDYDLVLAHDRQRVRVRVGGEAKSGFALSAKRHLELRAPERLRVAAIEVDEQRLRVRVAGADADTRVHLFASRFVAATRARSSLDRVRLPEPLSASVRRSSSHYLSGRDIGDEYRYILERRRAEIFAGTMLERPGLLLNPWARRGTSTGTESAKAGASFGAAGKSEAMARPPAAPAPVPRAIQAAPSNNLDFLAAPAYVALNLELDDEGVVTLAREELAGHQLVHVVAANARGLASRDATLPEVEAAPRDLRLDNGLAPDGHFVKRKQRTGLAPGATLTLDDIHTAKLEVVDTLAKAHALLLTLSNDSHLREFEFVTRWPSLSPEDQRSKYSKYACHELSLFLSRKDPAFFAAHIQPYLANKRDKTFIDHYLLGDDLAGYLEPWAYGRLNTLERILLATRVEGEPGPTARHINDRFDLLPPDLEGDNAAFDTALQGSALDTRDPLGLDELAAEAEAEAEELSLAEGGGGPSGGSFGGPPSGPPPLGPGPGGPPPTLGSPSRSRRKSKRAAPPAEAPMLDGLSSRARLDEDVAAREEARRLYRVLDKTQEWAENNYYRRPPTAQGPELIGVNAFWRDYAAHSGDGPFLSGHFVRATANFAEMMCALAVLDLPFDAEPTETSLDGAALTLGAKSPLITFHEQIVAVEPDPRPLGVLVSQNYFRADDRYRYEDNERHDKYVEGELLIHTVYVCQVVLTNPSSSAHKLELLVQIPRGAMPVSNGRATRDLHVHLPPHGTHAIEYAFYFPAPGSFAHFPVHVAKNGALAVFAAPTTLEVVRRLSVVDTASWSHVSQHADDDELLRYLDQHNVERLELSRVAWRMRERGLFEAILARLSRRHVYDDLLWSYAVHHADVEAIGVYLRHQDALLRGCGLAIDSPLIRVDPVTRGWYEHLEYAPLVNARAHQLGARRKILNTAFAAQYQAFLRGLVYLRRPSDEQLLAAASYLLLQDRVADGLALLERVDAQSVTGQLQFDYLRAYAALLVEDTARARELAARHREHPVDRWRERFANLLAVLDEAEGAATQVVDADSREQEHARLAATEVGFDFEVDGSTIALSYQNLAACTVSYYRMDIELLFSRQPFMKDQSGRFSIVQPNHSARHELPADQTEHRFELPPEYRSANTIIEIVGEGLRRSKANYAHDLHVRVIEQFGQLRVQERGTNKPLTRAYVKVYARKGDGAVGFYKDGYTDIRGAFDYASLSTNELDQVERFAILVMTTGHGALIRETAPPQR
ncbi:hypothetical protein ENSA5_09910 [Enhygromyxa salina]|uniref:Uncharacterized protein n=1 Tax=Enhygromyxa salina TaxID=215803 RepID=A0A2S9YGH0_9BACT|nr:hypothetical protein [Enhygromyxa salina]PRQ04207.1 hypothetical protein ENSA5_09910 [Enhygromyxa salina]